MKRLHRRDLIALPKGAPFKDRDGRFYLSLGEVSFWNPYMGRANRYHEEWIPFMQWYECDPEEVREAFYTWTEGMRVRNAWGYNGTIVRGPEDQQGIKIDQHDEPMFGSVLYEYMMAHGPFVKTYAADETHELILYGG